MRRNQFWLSQVDALTEAQREEAREVLSRCSGAEAALAAVEFGVDEERGCPRTLGAVGEARGRRHYRRDAGAPR